MNKTRELHFTEDGSVTFFDAEKGENFHSHHGAINESQHIFINAGLGQLQQEKQVTILEIGWGTGLNTLLTYQHNLHFQQTIQYHAIEMHPLLPKEFLQLNYFRSTPEIPASFLQNLHEANWNTEIKVDSNFLFIKYLADFNNVTLQSNFYSLIYFDAFSPETQPELWTKEVFQKIYKSCKPKAIFVTYSVKGNVRRALKEVGFKVEKIPGPKGKREITRATKE
ncbi:MAG: tRNA (5-methylaminomethyl-2-thiouridine)(34)-methyltransferase MnmD [Bacteroidales bacterium]|nr:tRNA (5-methylaminomethyl-2-thiouridine)(34)-methyltransferase MnmD [Bacteroidales bacterium]